MMNIRMNVWLVALCVMTFALAACDDGDERKVSVPERVTQALHSKYPAATDVEWEMKGGYYVADCRMDGRELDVWFGRSGDWVLTETELAWENLPPVVQTAFLEGAYSTWTREECTMLEYAVEPIQYVIEVEQASSKVQLFYATDGNLIEARDVTGKDDTHWPIVAL